MKQQFLFIVQKHIEGYLQEINQNPNKELKVEQNRARTSALLIASACLLSGCASTGAGYRPIVDGPQDERYHFDLADCQHLAKTRRYDDGDTKTSALAGAVIGGAAGGLDDESLEGAVMGALIGAFIGSAASAGETHSHRKEIVLR